MALQDVPERYHLTLKVLAKAFVKEGKKRFYVAWNGDRIYIGLDPAVRFKDKEGTPQNVVVTDTELQAD